MVKKRLRGDTCSNITNIKNDVSRNIFFHIIIDFSLIFKD